MSEFEERLHRVVYDADLNALALIREALQDSDPETSFIGESFLYDFVVLWQHRYGRELVALAKESSHVHAALAGMSHLHRPGPLRDYFVTDEPAEGE